MLNLCKNPNLLRLGVIKTGYSLTPFRLWPTKHFRNKVSEFSHTFFLGCLHIFFNSNTKLFLLILVEHRKSKNAQAKSSYTTHDRG